MHALWVELVRPLLAALLLPPFPFVLLIGLGVALHRRYRRTSWLALSVGCVGTWLGCCVGTGEVLASALLRIPHALTEEGIARLKSDNEEQPGKLAIVMLGSGIVQNSAEYREARLSGVSLERLRYGIWLSRRTGIPTCFSGGVGWAGEPGDSEAATAQRIATREFLHPLKWVEGESRDTIENARRSVQLLGEAGVRRVVLVTSGLHMQRALAAFARATPGSGITVEPAAMNLALRTDQALYAWIPSPEGYGNVHVILREWLGRLFGA